MNNTNLTQKGLVAKNIPHVKGSIIWNLNLNQERDSEIYDCAVSMVEESRLEDMLGEISLDEILDVEFEDYIVKEMESVTFVIDLVEESIYQGSTGDKRIVAVDFLIKRHNESGPFERIRQYYEDTDDGKSPLNKLCKKTNGKPYRNINSIKGPMLSYGRCTIWNTIENGHMIKKLINFDVLGKLEVELPEAIWS